MLTAREIGEISDRGGSDPEAGKRAEREYLKDTADAPDTRLPPKERALLGARGDAFATPEVMRRFNALYLCYPPLINRGEAPALTIKAALALDSLKAQVKAELEESKQSIPQRLRRRFRRRP